MAFNFLFSAFRPETALARAFQARKEKAPGLELAMQYAARELRVSRSPAVMIYADTLPAARVAKGLFGPGTLLVSQGLLSSFRDDEVVAVMRRGLQLMSQHGVAMKSSCSAWYVELERNRLKPWTPLRAIMFWSLLPWRNFLQRQDSKLNVFSAAPARESADDQSWRDALHKASCSERIFS